MPCHGTERSRSELVILVMGAWCACADREVRLRLLLPRDLAEIQGRRIDLELLNDAEGLSCERLAFDPDLRNQIAQRAPLRLYDVSSGSLLPGIERRGEKLVLGSAWDAEGHLRAFACAAIPPVPSDGALVVLSFDPATRMRLDQNSLGAYALSVRTLRGTIVDALERPIANAVVQIALQGDPSAETVVERQSDGAGVLALEPPALLPPDASYGPYTFRLTTRWALAGQETTGSFLRLPEPKVVELPLDGNGNGSAPQNIEHIVPCRLVSPGRTSLVAVASSCPGTTCQPTERTAHVSLLDFRARDEAPRAKGEWGLDAAAISQIELAACLPTSPDALDSLALVATTQRSSCQHNAEEICLITLERSRPENAWSIGLSPLALPTGVTPPDEVRGRSPCTPGGSPWLAFSLQTASRSDASWQLVSVGENGPVWFAGGQGALLDAGCVQGPASELRFPAAVVTDRGGPNGSPALHLVQEETTRELRWPAMAIGAAFTEHESILGAQLGEQGAHVVRISLVGPAEAPRLVVSGTLPVLAGQPQDTRTGDLDGDGRLDYAGLRSVGGLPALALLRDVERVGELVSAIELLPLAEATRLELVDLDGEGSADIVVWSGGAESSRITIYFMGVPDA